MKLSKRQEAIAHIVREKGPVTGSAIAEHLDVTRSALRSDLAVLTMIGVLEARPNVGYYYVGLSPKDQTAEILRSYSVHDVLSQAVIVSPETNLYDTIVTIFTEDVGTILVCEGSYLQGVVSRKDLLEPSDSLAVAAQKMIDYEVDCLPVIVREDDESQDSPKKRLKVVGRVSKTTVTKAFLECSTQEV
ncbi:MAG: HTH domain-containing protein [Veillonella sp.]|nr:HTH domain-containing protein [Veillonella sp.]